MASPLPGRPGRPGKPGRPGPVVRLGPVVQLAYAVTDVREAASRFAGELGAGPFLVRRHPPLAAAVHAGRPAHFDHSSAYGQWGGVQVELVQVHAAEPATLAAAVGAHGIHRVLGIHSIPGIHHVACFVDDLAAAQAGLEAAGWPVVLTAETAGGQRFAFHDARAELGHLLEVYEPGERVLRLYAAVADAARGWTGADPVREL